MPHNLVNQILSSPEKKKDIYEDPLQFLWAISYSDLLMVLMCFFIIYAEFSNLKKSDPILNVMKDEKVVQTGSRDLSGKLITFKSVVLSEIVGQFDDASLLKQKDRSSLLVHLPEDVFRSGQFDLNSSLKKRLNHISKILTPYKDDVSVVFIGHTDQTPMKSNRRIIDSNFALSNLRAAKAVQYFVQQGYDPAFVSGQGVAEFDRQTRSISLRISERAGSRDGQ